MAILDSSSGVLAPGVCQLGLERASSGDWRAWCEFEPGQFRHFEFMSGTQAPAWLAYVLRIQHGFEAAKAKLASDWLFEAVGN